MNLKTSGLKRRILRAVHAGWGGLKNEERVLRSQYNISNRHLDRYLKNYDDPTPIEIAAWEDQINYYKLLDTNVTPSKSEIPQLMSKKLPDWPVFDLEEQNDKNHTKRQSWYEKLNETRGSNEWIIRHLRKCTPIHLDTMCRNLLKVHTSKMLQFTSGFKYNREELNNVALIQGRNIIAGCQLTDQYPHQESDKTKLDMIESLLELPLGSPLPEIINKMYQSTEENNSSIDCIFKLLYTLHTGSIKRAMDFLKSNPRNLKMMNIMITFEREEILKLMNDECITPNFETFIQLLQNSNYQETINLIQYVLKNKIVSTPLWISMLKACIRTKNIELVDCMFDFNYKCTLEIGNGKDTMSWATYEIYDALATYYQRHGINYITLNSEICSLVYHLYKENENGEYMMKVVNIWEKINNKV